MLTERDRVSRDINVILAELRSLPDETRRRIEALRHRMRQLMERADAEQRKSAVEEIERINHDSFK